MRKFYSICTEQDVDDIALIESKYIECAWTREQIKQAMERSDYLFIKSEVGLNDETGELEFAGYGAVQRVLDEGDVCNIAVHEKYRNVGIGTGILNTMIHLLRVDGVKRLTLEVSQQNKAAIGLYEKLGFTVVGERKNYYKSGNANIMSLEL